MSTAVVQSAGRHVLVRPVAEPAALLAAHKEITALVASVLEPGVDFGVVPGTDRPTLLKPGAERLTLAIGAAARFTIVEREVDHAARIPWRKTKAVWEGPRHRRRKVGDEVTEGESLGLYRWVIKCELRRRDDDALLGEGLGACSTLEAKYCDRPRESENVVLKMASKRAHVAAVLSALGLTGRFERDDDTPDEDGVVADPTDGLTLREAEAMEVQGTPLGTLPAKALQRIEAWARKQRDANPDDARAARRLAAVELVLRTREVAEPPAADAAPAAESDGSADTAEPSALAD